MAEERFIASGMKIGNPDRMYVTLTLNMPWADWKALAAQLQSNYPSWKLKETIVNNIDRFEKQVIGE